MVVELPQIPYDIFDATTYIRLSDVYNVFSLAGERQHVELELHLVAVQLEVKMKRTGKFHTHWGKMADKLADQREQIFFCCCFWHRPF